KMAFDSLRGMQVDSDLDGQIEISKTIIPPKTFKSNRGGQKWPNKITFVYPEELVKEFIPKNKRSKCERCQRSFTLFRHKYHCQTCAEVYCSHCTTNQLALRPDGQSSFDVTMCWTCVHIGVVQSNFKNCKVIQKAVMALFHDPHYPPPNTNQLEHRILRLEAAHVVPYDRLMRKKLWVSLKDRSNCRACHDKFRFIMRKDHCRLCGEGFCFMCLYDILVSDVPNYDEWQVVPVCQACSTNTTKRIENDTASRYVAASTVSRSVAPRIRAASEAPPNFTRKNTLATLKSRPNEYRRGSNPDMLNDYPLDYSWGCQWPKAPTLPHEAERLQALRSFAILDTPRDDVFDIICELASNALKCPIAAVSLIDSERQWFKASVGLAQSEIPRDVAFCAHTIFFHDTMVVLDAKKDKRFAMNPLVTGPASVRFYAGAPIMTPSGQPIGTVFVFDSEPRQLGYSDIATLEKLAMVAMKNIEDRKEIASILSPPPTLPSVPEASVDIESSNVSTEAVVAQKQSTSPKEDKKNPLENMLMDLLCRTTDTQQQLASQQCAMFQTLGQHTAELDRLAHVARRMEAELFKEPEEEETFVLNPIVIEDEYKENASCFRCSKPFTLFRAKHYCHVCGEAICNSCLWALPLEPVRQPHHVCVSCYFIDKRIPTPENRGGRVEIVSNVAHVDDDTYSSEEEDQFPSNPIVWPPKQTHRAGLYRRNTMQSIGRTRSIPSPQKALTRHMSTPILKCPSLLTYIAHKYLVPPHEMVPKKQRTRCDRCYRAFTIFRHKNHCHTCGQVFCGYCTLIQLALRPDGKSSFRVRVCWTCVRIGSVQLHFGNCQSLQRIVMALFHYTQPPNTLQIPDRDVLTKVLRLEARSIVPYALVVPKKKWIPFSERSMCHACKEKFPFVMKKEHCHVLSLTDRVSQILKDRSCCSVCRRKFSYFRGKHNCNRCTREVCWECIRWAPLEAQGKDVTVCEPCYTTLKPNSVPGQLTRPSIKPFSKPFIGVKELLGSANVIPKRQRVRCGHCYRPFTILSLRYNCRTCGDVFCRDCTQSALALSPDGQSAFDVTVCRTCSIIGLHEGNYKNCIVLRKQTMSLFHDADFPYNTIHMDKDDVVLQILDLDTKDIIPSTRLVAKSRMVPLAERTTCHSCNGRFPFILQKNHCVTCGEAFCFVCLVHRFVATRPGHGSMYMTSQCIQCSAKQAAHANYLLYGDDEPPEPVIILPDLKMYQVEVNLWSYPWQQPPLLQDESEREKCLESYNILNTVGEKEFDFICDFAVYTLKCPIAAVSFMATDHQWFKACVGLRENIIPRNVSFCAHVIASKEPLIVLDTLNDERFVKNPLTQAGIRFYAGAPIIASTGYVVGTVFVCDLEPKEAFDHTCCEIVCSRCTWSLHIQGRDRQFHQVVVCVSCYFDKRIQDLVLSPDDEPYESFSNDRDEDDDTSSNDGDEDSYSEDVYPWSPTSERLDVVERKSIFDQVTHLKPLPEQVPEQIPRRKPSRLRPRRYAFVKRDDLLPKSELTPKKECTECERCQRSFKVLNRKYHCHTCGNVFCSHCSIHQFTAKGKGHALSRVRVCWTCAHVSIIQSSFRNCRRKQLTVSTLFHDPTFHPVQARNVEGRDIVTSVLQLEASSVIPYQKVLSKHQKHQSSWRECHACEGRFLFLLSKTFCRMCGEAFCPSCLENTLVSTAPSAPEMSKVKVCQACRLRHCEDVTKRFFVNCVLSNSYDGLRSDTFIAMNDIGPERLNPSQFIPLKERGACNVCTSSFTSLQDKFNCIFCGQVICKNCMQIKSIEDRAVNICVKCAPNTPSEANVDENVADVLSTEQWNNAHHSPHSQLASNGFPLIQEEYLLAPEKLMPMNTRTHCHRCCRQFGILRRKYHCRTCGDVYCAHCTLTQVATSSTNTTKEVTVCSLCYHVALVEATYANVHEQSQKVLENLHNTNYNPSTTNPFEQDTLTKVMRFELFDILGNEALIPRNQWVSTKEKTQCNKCHRRVPFILYKSHCSMCGEAFCVLCLHNILLLKVPSKMEMQLISVFANMTTLARKTSRRWTINQADLINTLKHTPLKDISTCTACLRKFSIFRSKYNCALCGKVMCRSCVLYLPVQDNQAAKHIYACELCLFHEQENRDQPPFQYIYEREEEPTDCLSTKEQVSETSLPHSPQEIVSAYNPQDSEAMTPMESPKVIEMTPNTGNPGPNRITFITHDELTLPIKKASKCTRCLRAFGFFRRQSACHTCGNMFCGHCTMTKLALRPDGQSSYDVTVCKTCIHIGMIQTNFKNCKTMQKLVLEQFHDPNYLPPTTDGTEYDDLTKIMRLECFDIIAYDHLIGKENWVSTKDRTQCLKCKNRVPFVMYKSHCHVCGEAYCLVCLHEILVTAIPNQADMQVVPICPSCHTTHYDNVTHQFFGTPASYAQHRESLSSTSDSFNPGTPPLPDNVPMSPAK
ncbi:hypothetical protein THRCLA_12225, partial [Thraustotheca clavata]